MIQCIFIENRMVGYATVSYSSSSESEIIIPVDKKKLISLVGKDWESECGKIILDDGELFVDDNWELDMNA